MHKKDKQHLVRFPNARFIDMLSYKAKLAGIRVMVQEESYTNKASFLDNVVEYKLRSVVAARTAISCC